MGAEARGTVRSENGPGDVWSLADAMPRKAGAR